jgi:putative ABC transport system substrate-binding protein
VGRNVNLGYRNSGNDNDRLRMFVAEFVRQQVAVIVPTTGTTAQAAKAGTRTIPIAFNMGRDPVEEGLAPNLNRPGGNVTGVAQLSAEIAAKRLELLHELVPTAEPIAALVRSEGPDSSVLTGCAAKKE